jgi:nucleoside-triphosphatase
MARSLFISGRPGVGKTTVIKRVAQVLGERADGFYTEEIRDGGKRQGFQLVGLRGERATLAHVKYQRRGQPRVGRYGVDVTAVDRVGVMALERTVTQGHVIIIDEIGKMELFSEAFRDAVLGAMNSQSPVVATVMAGRHPWVDTLKARPSVTLWEVTPRNRDEMPLRVLNWLRSVQET